MAASQGGLPGGTVLVVEDDFLIAELICTLLESAGYTARHAGDGAEALALVAAGGIELVLLDLMLPGINGFEVCRRVRARPEPVYLPIIMLTALQSPMDRAAGFAAGADDYLTKPFDTDALLERVAVWVRARRRLQAAEGARKQLEDQLQQAQKLDAVGRLAGGIAHDFNNLLTVISGCSELLQRELPPDDAVRQYVGEISRAGERAAELTHQLLAFSRQQVLQPRVVDLNEIVADTQTLLRRLIGENIEVLSGLHSVQPTVQVDPGQIQQVIVNLAVNARDAMPDGGRLTLETADVVLGADYVQEHFDVQPGSYVMLGVSDTGCGMDAERPWPRCSSRSSRPRRPTKALAWGCPWSTAS